MTRHQKIFKITLTAVLTALTVIISFLPIKTLGFEITLTVIPIAVGAIIGGKYIGLFLGTAFGVTSFLQCLGYSPLGVVLLSVNPFFTFLVCVPTRMLAGFLTGLTCELITKVDESNKTINLIAKLTSCVVMPVLNTLFFMGVLVLCFYNTSEIQYYVELLGATNPFTFVILFVGLNGLIEIIAGIVISFPLVKALEHAVKLK